MKAEETRRGGRHIARERGAFDYDDISSREMSDETPVQTGFWSNAWQFPGYSVPVFHFKEIAKWQT